MLLVFAFHYTRWLFSCTLLAEVAGTDGRKVTSLLFTSA